ncbi:CSL zinc finger [Ordospora pajunii]|uniref:CSL zinc finger n=1 Tax=Ordospora pajunii TaxID=3039483 RepID=UPI00295260E2|nr:CSL zinc finger [Ordospora pajunii]KAH9410837.1 CSL zinc finger [Ordospora pajunii]
MSSHSVTSYEAYFKRGIASTDYRDEVDDYPVYDEIDMKDFEYNSTDKTFYYPCPCGDRFEISLDDLRNGEIIAKCPSCSLLIRIVYEPDDLEMHE